MTLFKIFMMIIFAIFSLAMNGCVALPDTAEPVAGGETMESTILWIDWYGQPYVDEQLAEGETLPSSDMVFPDDALQKAVAALEAEFPLDSNERIITYMEELKFILNDKNYMESEIYPTYACHFNDIWISVYTTKPNIFLKDGAIAVYLSDIDGHIIDIINPY